MIQGLPRREREIFELLCSSGETTAAEIRGRMIDPPGLSSVRTLLQRLEERGLVAHRLAGRVYFYRSVPQADDVRSSALRSIVDTFFSGSAVSAATALLGLSPSMSTEERTKLRRLIDDVKASGR